MARNDLRRQGSDANIAKLWFDAGCSVVPIKPGGSKQPTMEWRALTKSPMSKRQMETLWRDPRLGVAVICGKVSMNLEMLEIESVRTDEESLNLVRDAADRLGVRDVWDRLLIEGYAEWSPSGGLHVLYRISDGEVPGNTKVARSMDGKKTYAETRGEGGYVIVAPSPGDCHISGEPWTTVAGKQGVIPMITKGERDLLHQAIAEALDETPPEPPPAPPAARRDTLLRPNALRPGDDFNQRASWDDILRPHGWRKTERRGKETLWSRPGKDPRSGHSASTGYADDQDRLYVWSTSAGLPSEQPLSKFYVYAALNHNEDFRAATRELARLGFGDALEPSFPTGWDTTGRTPTSALPPGPSAQDGSTGESVSSEGDVPKVDRSVDLTLTDSGNANRMLERLHGCFRYLPLRGRWMWFDQDAGIWKIDYGNVVLRERISVEVYQLYCDAVEANDQKAIKFFHGCLNDSRITALVRMLRGRPTIHTDGSDFDAEPRMLNLRNGVINLETLDFAPHTSADLHTKQMNVGYNPQATAPRWAKYLEEVLPDPEMRDFLQRLVGYTLTGEPVERALAILHGPGGTGKSRFVETLSALFGSYSVTAADSLFRSKRDAPTGPTNDLNDLRDARMASVSELDAGIKMDEALVKRLTGFDSITSRGLYQENETWQPRAMIWLATNHHFRISSDDGAIWRRLKVIPFTQQITEENEDPFIQKKLLAEADGIFNWMLEGLRKYRERRLAQPSGAKLALEAYKSEQDPVEQFLESAFGEDQLARAGDNDVADRAAVYRMYQQWCRDEGDFALGKQRFNRRMEALGYESTKRTGRFSWRRLRVNAMATHGMMGTM